jgi:hypothetical protein
MSYVGREDINWFLINETSFMWNYLRYCLQFLKTKTFAIIILNLGVCILLRVLDQVQGFPSNTILFQ